MPVNKLERDVDVPACANEIGGRRLEKRVNRVECRGCTIGENPVVLVYFVPTTETAERVGEPVALELPSQDAHAASLCRQASASRA